MPPLQLAREMEQGEVDLAIGYFPDLVQNTFFQQCLFTHHFACLMRAGHPLYSERLSLEVFLEMEHAVVRAEGRSHELFESFLERRRIRRKIVLHTPHFLPIIVARSDLMATVPHALALYFARVFRDSLPSPRRHLRSRDFMSCSTGTASSTTTRATSGCASR